MKCEGPPLSQQTSCKDTADSNRDAAKARAAKARDDAKSSAENMKH